MLCLFHTVCISKTLSESSTSSSSSLPTSSSSSSSTILRRMIVDEVSRESDDDKLKRQCEELPKIVLAQLLGEAYNSRYMSINWPISSDENDDQRNEYSVVKRRVDNVPSFYVEEKHTMELSDKPAWDLDDAEAIAEIENLSKRRRRRKRLVPIDANSATDQSFADDSSERNKRAFGRSGSNAASGANKLYPWKCEAAIKWVDLGPDYFPRFLRTVECTKHYCWYKAFVCKPKSFAVKILHRRKGMCANAENLRKISAFDFRGDFGELWKWEEVAINFCCDCTIA